MSGEKSQKKIEVTPEMLKAGIRLIAEEYGVCGDDIAEDLAPDVFRAMWAARAKSR